MKVLHVYRTYFPDPPGGLQEAVRQICRATTRGGVANTVFALSPSPEPDVLEVPEARIVRRRSHMAPASCDIGGPSALRCFRGLVAAADVVHFLHPWPFADLLGLTLSTDKPVVVTYVSDIVRQHLLGRFYAPLMWRHLLRADVVVANAPAYARTSSVLSDARIAERVRVVPLGIVEEDDATATETCIVERLGLRGRPFFLFLGVLRYYKGLRFLVEACARSGVCVVVAGDGPERDAMLAHVRQTGADVRFSGFVTDPEKHALLDAAHALILPSHLRSEAFGMVLVEAMMRGKPMISTEIGTGTSFVNEDRTTGFVVAPGDPAALADAMTRLVRDPDLARRLGTAARRRYEILFSGDALERGYVAAYEAAIAARAEKRRPK